MKHLLIIAALLSSFGAQAQALNMICGDSVATLNADNENVLQTIVIDNIYFTVDPTVTRKVENGKMITFFQANSSQKPVIATVVMRENGGLGATLYSNGKTIWRSNCRWAN